MGPVMIMAGGTGGHIFPALAVAKQLQSAGCEVFWLGSSQGLEARLVPEHGFILETMPVVGLRNTSITRIFKAPFQLAQALIQAWKIIRHRKPAVALGMGGFASGPGGLMAWLLSIPLIVHEQNKIPGLTNRWLSKLATRTYEAFPDSFPVQNKAIACGNPVRQEIIQLPVPAVRWNQRTGPLRLLVLGGSQGASALNQLVPQALALLPANLRPQVRHQAGPRTLQATQAAYQTCNIEAEILPFIADMAAAYGWADLAIARAGALTLSELAAAGLGSILIPFPHAVDDHQTHNAAWLVTVKAAQIIQQSTLTAELLAATLRPFAEDRTQTLALAEAARTRAQPTAVNTIADACLQLITAR